MRKINGFSLVEFILVIAIIAILAVIAFPSFQRYYRTYKYNEYVMQVESTLKWARMVAMERSVNVSICVQGNSLVVYNNGTNRQLQCSGTVLRRVNITDNFVQVIATGGGANFDPRGLAIMGSTIRVQRTDTNACKQYAIQTLRGAIIKREVCQ